jgi:hypothetical protein
LSIPFDHFEVDGVSYIGSPTPNQITIQSPATEQTINVVAVYMGIAALLVTWPTSPQQASAALRVTFTFSNHGGDGVFTFTLRNGSTVLGNTQISAASGTVNNQGLIDFAMPSSDAALVLTSDYGGEADATIQLLSLVPTTLTLSLPASASPGSPVPFSGQLTRADGGQPGVEQIQIISGSTVYATVNTAADGSYSGSFTAPATTTIFYASFAGSGLLSASLSLRVRLFR